MIDIAGNEINVGDKVKIIRCKEYPNFEGRLVTVMEHQDCAGKIKVSFSDQWCGYFRFCDVIKISHYKDDDTMIRNAEYFREFQGVTSIEEQLNEAVECILNKIEEYIKNGGKDTYLDISFENYEGIYSMAIDKLREMNFKIYQIVLYHNGEFRFTISWNV